MDVNIRLLSCNSATDYNGSNFACDTSNALTVFFRYRAISVTGYTGFIEVKSNAKFTVSSVLGRSTKGTHSDLDSARVVYRNGEVCFRNKIMIKTLSMMEYSWAKGYINQTNRERKLIESVQRIAVVREPDVVRRAASQDTLYEFHGIGVRKKGNKIDSPLRRSNSHPFFSQTQDQDWTLDRITCKKPHAIVPK